jgi:peroxiredoxin
MSSGHRPFLALLVFAIGFAPSSRAVEAAPLTIAAAADVAQPLAVGATAPTAILKTADGADFKLAESLATKPTILVFYRGGWCPFCNTQLAELQKSQDKFIALGYQILAISPDAPGSMPDTVEKNHLGYTLLSDRNMQASAAFGIAWRTEAAMAERYATRGIALAPVPDEPGAFWLPVPSVFVVRPPGVIAYAFSDPNFRVRPPVNALLEAATAAVK